MRERIAHRLGIEDASSHVFHYLHHNEPYTLEDNDDFEIFLDRHANESDVDVFLGTARPQQQQQPQPSFLSQQRQSEQSLQPYLPQYLQQAQSGQATFGTAPPINYAALSAPTTQSPNVPVLNESTLVTRTPARGKTGSVSIHRVQPAAVPGVEEFVEAGGVSGGGRDSLLYPPQREPYTPTQFKSPMSVRRPNLHAYESQVAPSVRTKRTTQSQVSQAQSSLQHKVAFEEFHSSRGVRLLRGSLGPVNNVPMMLKNGYRHVYVSRSFALDHGFIPADTQPGTYGYNGITNLGKWPVQVGSKAVPLTVMLAEDSYFPVILGRSFMEKRGVRTDPIDMTSVIFMDNGERADVEVVVVRDELGQPVAIP